MKVELEYVPQYDDFDDYCKPIGRSTGFKWLVHIYKSPTQSMHHKLLVKPTKRQVRKLVKEYVK